MRLPPDNSIRLAPVNTDLVLDRSVMPLADLADALALLPAVVRDQDSALRDALLTAWAAQARLLWARSGRVLAQLATPRDAAGAWLDELGETQHRRRAPGEDDPAYRARLLNPPDVVSPAAVDGAVAALVAEVSPLHAAVLEPATDAVFLQTAANAAAADQDLWCAWWQPASNRLWADYPDNPNPFVGAYWTSVQSMSVPEFWVVVPQGVGDDSDGVYALPLSSGLDPDFLAPAVYPAAWAATDARFWADRPDSLMDRLLSEVEQRRAGGVRWLMFPDPFLATAV